MPTPLIFSPFSSLTLRVSSVALESRRWSLKEIKGIQQERQRPTFDRVSFSWLPCANCIVACFFGRCILEKLQAGSSAPLQGRSKRIVRSIHKVSVSLRRNDVIIAPFYPQAIYVIVVSLLFKSENRYSPTRKNFFVIKSAYFLNHRE